MGSWRRRAACRGRNPDPWFSSSEFMVEEARAVCFDCPVRNVCLGEQLDYEHLIGHTTDGMFGGRTPADRRVLLGMRT